MFSRSVPPTHCVSGSDSIGKHVSRELMASSARRGVMSALACMNFQKGRGAKRTPRPIFTSVVLVLLFGVLCLVDLQLFIEPAHVRLQFIDRGIVLLRQ